MNTILNLSALSISLLSFISCGQTSPHLAENKQSALVEAGNCDSPDASAGCCFINMPAQLTHVMSIAKENEPGERLVITGKVLKPDGTPYGNVILYAYHTDNTGLYSKKGGETGAQKWHGHLHGWCKTGSDGSYELHSIRPARYPDNTLAAHIHCVVKEPGGKEPYFISDFVFKDDSLISGKYSPPSGVPGGAGVVDVIKNPDQVWTGKRDIQLPGK